jgi:hypothetical protein
MSPQAFAMYGPAYTVDPMQLKHVLRQINTDCPRFHGGPPRIVEEPQLYC